MSLERTRLISRLVNTSISCSRSVHSSHLRSWSLRLSILCILFSSFSVIRSFHVLFFCSRSVHSSVRLISSSNYFLLPIFHFLFYPVVSMRRFPVADRPIRSHSWSVDVSHFYNWLVLLSISCIVLFSTSFIQSGPCIAFV